MKRALCRMCQRITPSNIGAACNNQIVRHVNTCCIIDIANHDHVFARRGKFVTHAGVCKMEVIVGCKFPTCCIMNADHWIDCKKLAVSLVKESVRNNSKRNSLPCFYGEFISINLFLGADHARHNTANINGLSSCEISMESRFFKNNRKICDKNLAHC